MINPDKKHFIKGTIVELGPSWMLVQLKSGHAIESELMNVSGYKIGDRVKGWANYSIVADDYVVRNIKSYRGAL